MAFKRRRQDGLAEEDREWRNLPKDVLYEIHQRLNDKTENKFELRRIRSVCSSWRSSLPVLRNPLEFPLELPPPSFLKSTDNSSETFSTATLSQSDIFLFPSPLGNQGSGWLVKVEERPESSKWRIENPISMTPASFEHPELFRGSMDIFDCHIKEITRSYMLKYHSSIAKEVKHAKVNIIWNNSKDKFDDFSVLALFEEGRLGLWRPGEASWSNVQDPTPAALIETNIDSVFSDIITFEGKFYATTMKGKLVMIDPITCKAKCVITEEIYLGFDVPFSNLVESNGHLYLVHKDVFTDCYQPEAPRWVEVFMFEANSGSKDNEKCSWKEVTDLEDRVFLASDNNVSFSVSAQDLGWSKGNCVLLPFDGYCLFALLFLFGDEDLIKNKLVHWPFEQNFADCLSVYNLPDSTNKPSREKGCQLAKIFWPPPDWLLQVHFKYVPHCSAVSSVNFAPPIIVRYGDA